MECLAAVVSNKALFSNLSLSEDGYVRLALAALQHISVQHLHSGLTEEPMPPSFEGASRTEICGYTEWISLTTPALSVGWDWRIDLLNQIVIVGLPYSNLMLLDECRNDYGQDKTLRLLADWMSTLEWQEKIKAYINQSYS